MKQSISTSTTLKMAFVFTIIFSAFLAISITYNKAYRLKNESISIIEKYEGITDNSIDLVNNFLRNNGYNTKGGCQEGEYGVSSLESTSLSLVGRGDRNRYFYCLKSRCTETHCRVNGTNKIYYSFKLFFRFDLPLMGDLALFKINGETKGIFLTSKIKKL